MSRMISARIPDSIYEQGLLQLKSLGMTPSQLINAAFEYLLSENSLPQVSNKENKSRTLSKKDHAHLKNAFRACTVDVNMPSDIAYDKRTARESRAARHENLA